MGKAQSKRSVDITTETKKGPEGGEEVTGKLEKIEDIDQKQVNGDATPQEKSDAAGGGEKKDAPDETEHDKDLTTEKSAAEAAAATPSPTTNADGSGDQTANETSPKEDAAAATPVKEGEEISPLADEGSNKKSKKEKLKKKWSFRNLSFGKKDKSKPKSESAENAPAAAANAENAAAATNGEAAETSQPAAEGALADAPKTDEAAGAAAAETKPAEAEKIENGVATEADQKQMNGQKTPTSTDEAAEQKKPLETNETAAAATTAVTSPPAEAAAAAVSNDTANEKVVVETIVSNGTADAEKNGIAHDVEEHHAEEKTTAAEESNSKSIPVDDEKPHQNGTNGDEAVEEITAATKTLQIEVKTEHPTDSNNSTITSTTTTTTTNSYTTTNTNTTSNTIPADNFNTEQKTVDADHHSNLLISTAQHTTDPTTTTTNTTSELPTHHSSNKSVDKCEEPIQPCKVILNNVANEESPIVVEVEEELMVTSKPNVREDAESTTNEAEEVQQEQQQQQATTPPPLPVTAPPSQVAIFALKSESDETAEENPILEAEGMPTIGSEMIEDEAEPTPAIEIVESLIETTATTAANGEEETFISIIKSFEGKLDGDEFSGEIIDLGEVGGMTPQAFAMLSEQFTANAEDLEAEALNIVDQIEKELEKQEAADYEDQKQQQQPTEIEDVTEMNQQPIDMDVCSQSSQDNSLPPPIEEVETPETLLPPPPPPSQLLDEQNMDEEEVIETLNDCIGESIEISVDSKHHNGGGKGKGEGDQLKEFNIGNNADAQVDFDLMKKVDKLSLIAEQQHEEIEQLCENHGLSNLNHNLKDAITATAAALEEISEHSQHDVDENCTVGNTCGAPPSLGDFDDKEMPTAKELKENAAAAEIKTQDLPVTCE